MVRLQIVNLFFEHHGPQILAQELDHVQVVGEARAVSREPLAEPLAHAEPEPLEPHVHAVPEDICLRQAVGREERA